MPTVVLLKKKRMKKYLLAFGLLSAGLLPAQETSHNSLDKGGSSVSKLFANDIIIDNAPTINQRNVKLSVAFNGWVYTVFSTFDSVNNAGGFTFRSSKDNGITWQTIDSYSVPGVTYEAHDIVVAGTDTNNLTLYLVGIYHNPIGPNYSVFVDRYNATTGAFIGSNFSKSYGTRKVYDVAIASDYRFPAVGTSPYSVGFIYSVYSSSLDSIYSQVSVDGGSTFSVTQPVAGTWGYFRKVSLAYGRSSSGSNGRYFAAWEQLGSSTARNGHIFTSRNQSTVDGTWITPVNLDSVSSTMINLCRNPQIASQFGIVDNDSASLTSVVLVERDYFGNGADYDLLGFYNKRSHYTNYWNRLDVVNSGENDLQPDISYDPVFGNFLATYYDSTNSKLPYIVNGFNLTTPSTWVTITPQYNDLTNLRSAYPKVEINPVMNQTAHAWNAEGVSGRGVAMFDAEYNFTAIAESAKQDLYHYVSPNPSSDVAYINFSLEQAMDVTISIYNAIGQKVEEKHLGHCQAGDYKEKFEVNSLENGAYIYQIFNGTKSFTNRFIVAH